MAKKTKKEKIIAEYRRKLTTIREARPVHPEPKPLTYQIPKLAQLPQASVQSLHRAIRRDLVKTLVLAAVAIAGEVALSRLVT